MVHKSGNFGPLPAYCHIVHAQVESATCRRRFLEMAARSGPQRKRTDLKLDKKVEIVQLIEEKRLSQIKIAMRFKCSQSTISKIVKNKDVILREADNNKPHSRKRRRLGKAEDVEEALYMWLVRETRRLQAQFWRRKTITWLAFLASQNSKPRMAGYAGGNRDTASSSRKRTVRRRTRTLTLLIRDSGEV